MGGKRRNWCCCKAMVAQLIAAAPGECPRLAAVLCFAPRVHPSHPKEELGELRSQGELRYVVSELALYSHLTHERKFCSSGFHRQAFPIADGGCFGGGQIKKKTKY